MSKMLILTKEDCRMLVDLIDALNHAYYPLELAKREIELYDALKAVAGPDCCDNE